MQRPMTVGERRAPLANEGLAALMVELIDIHDAPLLVKPGDIMIKLLSLMLLLSFGASDMHAATGSRESKIMLVAGQTCKQVSDCAEAVALWCGGYRRADADHDGIPCENVCHTLQQVEQIKRQIGC